MRDVPVPAESVQDPWEKNVPGLGLGRDPERTPMQWDDSAHAGFSTAEPWLPPDPQFASRNVAFLAQQSHSILNLYRDIIALRRDHPALSIGQCAPVLAEDDVLAYERRDRGERILVVLNFSHEPQRCSLPGEWRGGGILLSSHLDRQGHVTSASIDLRPDEGLIMALLPAKSP